MFNVVKLCCNYTYQCKAANYVTSFLSGCICQMQWNLNVQCFVTFLVKCSGTFEYIVEFVSFDWNSSQLSTSKKNLLFFDGWIIQYKNILSYIANIKHVKVSLDDKNKYSIMQFVSLFSRDIATLSQIMHDILIQVNYFVQNLTI